MPQMRDAGLEAHPKLVSRLLGIGSIGRYDLLSVFDETVMVVRHNSSSSFVSALSLKDVKPPKGVTSSDFYSWKLPESVSTLRGTTSLLE
jgi:hypothetical protein